MPSTLTEVRLRLQVLSRVGCKNVSSKQARTSYLQYIPQSRMQSQASGHRGARGEALPGDSVHGGRLSFLGTAGVRRESRRGCFWHQEPRMSPRKLYGFGPFGNWRSTATLACTCTNSVVVELMCQDTQPTGIGQRPLGLSGLSWAVCCRKERNIGKDENNKVK